MTILDLADCLAADVELAGVTPDDTLLALICTMSDALDLRPGDYRSPGLRQSLEKMRGVLHLRPLQPAPAGEAALSTSGARRLTSAATVGDGVNSAPRFCASARRVSAAAESRPSCTMSSA